MPEWVSDRMVLPSGRDCSINGTTAPSVVVTVEFAGQKKTGIANGCGEWSVTLDPLNTSDEARCLTVRSSIGNQAVTIDDIVVGDIWVCSGQSNMLRPVSATVDGDAAREDVKTADVRFFDGSNWIKARVANIDGLQAVPFFFAVEMARRQNAPVGVFVAARGGTGIEAWVPSELFPDTEIGRRLRPLVDDPEVLKAAEEDEADVRKYGEHRLARWGLGRAVPSTLFEKWVKPFGDLPACGVLWYQGERNADTLEQAREYDQWLKRLITACRVLWAAPELPFVLVQLPEYDPGSKEGREAWATVQKKQQTVAEDTVNTVLVDTHGLGDLGDIHPPRKKDVGVRAARAALKLKAPSAGKFFDEKRCIHPKI